MPQLSNEMFITKKPTKAGGTLKTLLTNYESQNHRIHYEYLTVF